MKTTSGAEFHGRQNIVAVIAQSLFNWIMVSSTLIESSPPLIFNEFGYA